MDPIQTSKIIFINDLKNNNTNINNTNNENNKIIDNIYNRTNDYECLDLNDTENKKIVFTGTSTKYQMKKIDPIKKEKKKRVETNTWGLDDNQLSFETQLEILKNICVKDEIKPNKFNKLNNYSNLIVSHIKSKISSYKQQDILKNMFLDSDFVSYDYVIQLLNDCELKCCYCSCETYLLYEFVREMKQWSLDRINNDIGHNKGNLIIACLECNLKRRRTNKDSFMFTKNLKISREGI